MYRWLLYGHLLGVGLLVLGTGAHWLATEALRREHGRDPAPGLLHVAERGVHLVIAGGTVLVTFGVALAVHAGMVAEPWIIAALVLVAFQGLSGRLVAERAARRSAQTDPGDPSSSSGGAGRLMNASARASLPVLAELEFLMAVKPTVVPLLGSVAAALTLAGLLAWTALRPPRQVAVPTRRP